MPTPLMVPIKSYANGMFRPATREEIKDMLAAGTAKRGPGRFEFYLELPPKQQATEDFPEEPEEQQDPEPQVYNTRDMVAQPNRRRRRGRPATNNRMNRQRQTNDE